MKKFFSYEEQFELRWLATRYAFYVDKGDSRNTIHSAFEIARIVYLNYLRDASHVLQENQDKLADKKNNAVDAGRKE